MFTHTADRLITTDPAHLPAAVDDLVAGLWGPLAEPITDGAGGMPRTFGIRADATDPAADVWLTFRAEPAGDRTRLRLALDELDPGPDPAAGLAQVLDLLAASQTACGSPLPIPDPDA